MTEVTFANQLIAIPAGLKRYSTRLAFTVANQTLIPDNGLSAPGANSIVADVQAVLDVPTRTLTLTLTALDPSTGWYPEDPLIGLLYPEDGTGRGDGSISYVVRPAAGVATGTIIPNRAHIVFDYNDAIDTPRITHTMDAAAPSSQVTALPVSIASATFPVQWGGQDDANGSGLASYDIYLSEDGGPWIPWQVATTDVSAQFPGRFGHSYSFYSIGRDNVGNVELPPATPDTTVRVNHNPVAGPDSLGATQDRPASVSARKLLLNDSDADGDPLTLTLAGTLSSQGGSVSLANGAVRYMPPPGFSGTDTFTYLVSDGLGGSGQGTVTVTVRPASAAPANPVSVRLLANGHMQLSMVGIPGRTYLVQVSDDLMTWSTLTTMSAGANGEFQFEDTDAANHAQRFYRLALP